MKDPVKNIGLNGKDRLNGKNGRYGSCIQRQVNGAQESVSDIHSLVSRRQIDLAVLYLLRNIETIYSVSCWAERMGYSRTHFCRKFRELFSENPKDVLKRTRLQAICRYIESDWGATAYKVARDSGLGDEKALHKFLKRHYRIGFSDLRNHLKRNFFRMRTMSSNVADQDVFYHHERD